MTKLTKDMFCYRIGFNCAIQGIQFYQNEIDIAWNSYCELPENCTDAETMIAICKCADDIIACTGSLKE